VGFNRSCQGSVPAFRSNGCTRYPPFHSNHATAEKGVAGLVDAGPSCCLSSDADLPDCSFPRRRGRYQSGRRTEHSPLPSRGVICFSAGSLTLSLLPINCDAEAQGRRLGRSWFGDRCGCCGRRRAWPCRLRWRSFPPTPRFRHKALLEWLSSPTPRIWFRLSILAAARVTSRVPTSAAVTKGRGGLVGG
jgi:hypothetical protein